ncbi:SMC-Scp complex subunit ScpB [Granulicatella adiacens ATCC 49175]|uniref:Segregation and condensation protein B n=1 Tax=Granulicatella adiacens ATCC 49175 TaxID=638301 RepID=C8NF43_9LACT|nr:MULTISPECIES: SMC-Scp complex subunit ScpB [Granulicatella]RKW26852.1 MAG: SMC-Scp complex subunit ScpB [Granulicatella sp.]EEW37752.1 segregation and condensation protein B [Granulicatella adiacens ATCC 49175]MBS4949918.1 SMC-Scp complex subunit ScpB [Granulicatella adiacens]MCT2160259.1 SMC-Scp complex subunit ScpB [Granulicatella adiacens]UAK93595.1 SMC-Scp complex subunit ScpB [Granulicatella adiacens]
MTNYISVLEGLLFVAGDDGITLEEASYILELERSAVRQLLDELKKRLEDENSGLELLLTASHYKLVTKASLKSYIEKYAVSPYSSQLSQASLETLAIIAYKQPVTRVDIESIRGVQSSGSIQKLLLRDLIEEAGRLETPGRPKLYKTTAYFMDYFGLESLDALPDASDLFDLDSEEANQLFRDNHDLFEELEIRSKEHHEVEEEKE